MLLGHPAHSDRHFLARTLTVACRLMCKGSYLPGQAVGRREHRSPFVSKSQGQHFQC